MSRPAYQHPKLGPKWQRTWMIKPEQYGHDDLMAIEIAALLGDEPFRYRSSRRRRGTDPMLPPSAIEASEFWESCHGDNVPILTDAEIEHLKGVGVANGID